MTTRGSPFPARSLVTSDICALKINAVTERRTTHLNISEPTWNSNIPAIAININDGAGRETRIFEAKITFPAKELIYFWYDGSLPHFSLEESSNKKQ